MKSEFLTELIGKQITDDIFEHTEPLLYRSAILKCTIKIPVGFRNDKASVPRIPIIYELYGNKAHHEGTLHDYLFRKDSDPVVTFMQANRVFLEAMKARGKSFFVRQSMFMGVCLGGYFSYHKKSVMDEI